MKQLVIFSFPSRFLCYWILQTDISTNQAKKTHGKISLNLEHYVFQWFRTISVWHTPLHIKCMKWKDNVKTDKRKKLKITWIICMSTHTLREDNLSHTHTYTYPTYLDHWPSCLDVPLKEQQRVSQQTWNIKQRNTLTEVLVFSRTHMHTHGCTHACTQACTQAHTQKNALWQTFGSSEVDGLRQRADSFGILGLNSEVINRVEVQIHNLMGQPVTTYCFHHPIIYRHVLIQCVVKDVTYWTRSYRINKSWNYKYSECSSDL